SSGRGRSCVSGWRAWKGTAAASSRPATARRPASEAAMAATVPIAGAAGNLGGKLRRHLEGRFPLRLLDRATGGDEQIAAADLAEWGEWSGLFRGAEVVVHLAADPTATLSWPEVVGPNLDALINT